MPASSHISIQQFIQQVSYIPTQNSRLDGWEDIILLKYVLEPGEVYVPELSEHLLFVSLLPKIQYKNLNDRRPKKQTLRQGDVTITPAGFSQHWQWLTSFSAINLFIPKLLVAEISKDLVKGDPESVRLIELKATAVPFLSTIAIELLSELEAGEPFGKPYIDSLTRSLVMALIIYYSTAKTRDQRVFSKPDNTYVRCAIDFIQDHLSEDLRLTRIASACGISINHLCTVFKQSVGQSVHQYVIQQRIEKAKVLLKNRKKSIVEISQETGFSNQAHFTNSFRKYCRITPSQYRKELE
ncbi:MAG: helix-turn-helix transcriptional regulator [Phormidesmis sp.]